MSLQGVPPFQKERPLAFINDNGGVSVPIEVSLLNRWGKLMGS
jgi:hypothetical protein